MRHWSPSGGLQPASLAAPAPIQGALFATAPVSNEADLAWHVRAWGMWVLERARADLAPYYPTVDGKPTVAYLWARTVGCKSCRATIPLLKTRWLCKKDSKRVALTMQPNAERTGVVFGVCAVPVAGGNNAQRRAHDREVGGGTMSRSGAACPCCGTIMTMADIRLEARAGRLGATMTAVVVDGPHGKEYRLPTDEEIRVAAEAADAVPGVFAHIPFGLPTEPLPSKEALGFRVPLYGLDQWYKLFTPRQLLALGTFVTHTRAAREAMLAEGYPGEWVEALNIYLVVSMDRLLDVCNSAVQWKIDVPTINHSFARFALPIVWDYAEGSPIGESAGSYELCCYRICTPFETTAILGFSALDPQILHKSATDKPRHEFDVIVTDPPYYDAIPYSDLMDFFYVWLRRALYGLSLEMDATFGSPLAPKWNHDAQDGELIDDSSRFGGDKVKSKTAYEDGMVRAFQACHQSLATDGRLVIVFAHKQPDAWETLVSAIIRAGFVVDGSWPIQTEQTSRMRAIASAALSSSVWLVCKKRPATARPGWDNLVLEDMRAILHGASDPESHPGCCTPSPRCC